MNPASDTQSGSGSEQYPVRFGVAYPDRPLNRLSSAFRIITVIPILIVLALVTTSAGNHLGADAGRDRQVNKRLKLALGIARHEDTLRARPPRPRERAAHELGHAAG